MEYALGVKEVKGEVAIGRPDDVAKLLADYRDLEREVMLVVHLDMNLEAKYIQTVAIGNKLNCCFEVRDIFREAILRKSDEIILVHNHPQERRAAPTKNDHVCTQNVYDVSKAIKIPLVDHVILAKHDLYSFRREGVILLPRVSIYIVDLEGSNIKRSSRVRIPSKRFRLSCGGSPPSKK